MWSLDLYISNAHWTSVVSSVIQRWKISFSERWSSGFIESQRHHNSQKIVDTTKPICKAGLLENEWHERQPQGLAEQDSIYSVKTSTTPAPHQEESAYNNLWGESWKRMGFPWNIANDPDMILLIVLNSVKAFNKKYVRLNKPGTTGYQPHAGSLLLVWERSIIMWLSEYIASQTFTEAVLLYILSYYPNKV